MTSDRQHLLQTFQAQFISATGKTFDQSRFLRDIAYQSRILDHAENTYRLELVVLSFELRQALGRLTPLAAEDDASWQQGDDSFSFTRWLQESEQCCARSSCRS